MAGGARRRLPVCLCLYDGRIVVLLEEVVYSNFAGLICTGSMPIFGVHRLPRVLFAHPVTGCVAEGTLQGRAAPGARLQAANGSILVAEGGGACTATARVLAAASVGALALIVASESPSSGFPAPSAYDALPRGIPGQLPVGGVPRSTLFMLQRLANDSGQILLQVDGFSRARGERAADVAAFSAFGPTDDGVFEVVRKQPSWPLSSSTQGE